MKKIFFLIVITAVFISCDKRKYDVPEVSTNMPTYVNDKNLTFITIAELKGLYPNFAPFEYDTIRNTGKAIRGTVIGNDESGNIYKQMYIQDATGAIIIGTNLTGLFALHPVGQDVVVELDDISIGKYGGSFQLGGTMKYVSSSGNVSIGRMVPYEFYNHVFRDGQVHPQTVIPTVLTAAPVITEENRNTLVQFDSVYFEGAGSKIFARKGSSYGEAYIRFSSNNDRIMVRTSEYANFAADTLPTGIGSIVCILGAYETASASVPTIQLTIRDKKDIKLNKQ